MWEATFALLKPEAIAQGLVGEIIRRLEAAGPRLAALQMRTVPRELAERHYGQEIADKYGADVRQWLLDYLISGPVVVMVLVGENAARVVRRTSGEAADPPECAPGTIRRDLCDDTRAAAMAEGRALRNLIHTSDAPESAHREIALWFGEGFAASLGPTD
ncbi:MAG: nucleoside-diphosphate kinase [Armatimonadetes bacterium]|nr:nucleoside-diphosphate kinase [Armatimonadota bacterium]